MKRLMGSILILTVGLGTGCGSCGKPESPTDKPTDQSSTDGGDATVVGSIPFPELCENISSGFREHEYQSFSECQVPISREDLLRLYKVDFNGVQITYKQAFAANECTSPDSRLAKPLAAYGEAISAGRLGYRPEQAFNCRELGRARRDGGIFLTEDLSLCTGAFFPRVPEGGSCASDAECLGDNTCRFDGAVACLGVCTAPIKLGESCSPDVSVCASGALCKATDRVGVFKCVAGAEIDQPCQENKDCRPELGCFEFENATGVSRVCKPMAALGQTCFLDAVGISNCTNSSCVTQPGAKNGVCKKYAQIGETCGDGSDGQPPCDLCTLCGFSGKCEWYGRQGDDCFDDGDCFEPQVWACVQGKCQLRVRPGEACVSVEDGQQGSCLYVDTFCRKSSDGGGDNGLCAPLPKLGEACGAGRSLSLICASGFCNEATGLCDDFAAEGEPCAVARFPFMKLPTCGPGLTCEAESTPGDGGNRSVCRAFAAIGETCNSHANCAPNHFCNSGTSKCQADSENGTSCQEDDECKSAHCQESADAARSCAPLLADGAPCTLGKHCLSQTCDAELNQCLSLCSPRTKPPTSCIRTDLTSLSTYLFFAMLFWTRGTRKRRKKPTSSFLNRVEI